MFLEETNIRSSKSFLSTVVRLEPFLEGGETVSVSDGAWELIPPSVSADRRKTCVGTGRS